MEIQRDEKCMYYLNLREKTSTQFFKKRLKRQK